MFGDEIIGFKIEGVIVWELPNNCHIFAALLEKE